MKEMILITIVILLMTGAAAPAGEEKVMNLARNPGFETKGKKKDQVLPEWSYYSTEKDAVWEPAEGKGAEESTAICFVAQGVKNSTQGVFQDMVVEPGECFNCDVYVRNDRSDPLEGSCYGQIIIEWRTEKGQEISRDVSDVWNSRLTSLRWKRYSLNKACVPEGAEVARVGIHLFDGGDSSAGRFYADNISIEKQ